MQFQNPEIFYFLALLIIPILVHLFQLQKFVKISFTNVAFLKRIIQDNRKSSKLKKWLILASRILLLLAILFAFSQPYLSNKNNNQKQHVLLYIDNSLSTNTKGERGDLLKTATKDVIENASKNDEYSLLTNTLFLKNISYDEVKKQLLLLENEEKNLNFESVLLKIINFNNTKTNTLNKNILISDFQNIYNNMFTNVTGDFSLVKLNSSRKNNLSIDSVFINTTSIEKSIINVTIKNQGKEKNNIPIALYNNNKLVSKQSFSISENTTKLVSFSIQNTTEFKGKLSITFSDTFIFDNSFYFNINPVKKINVLSIGKSNNNYQKIYIKNEFNLTQNSLKNLDYNAIEKQELILLHELENIPEILIRSLVEFSKRGGTLVVIPNSKININSYNNLFRQFSNFRIQSKKSENLKITKINFNHPLFKNVFSKKVTNFQYPSVNEYYQTNSNNSNPIIQFENNKYFINQINSNNKNIYFLSSSLNTDASNFSKSPLIVPVFYNFGKLSFKHSQIYFHSDKAASVDIDLKLEKDKILRLAKSNQTFIPPQRTYQNKVSINLEDQLLKKGFYTVLKDTDTIQTIAINHPKGESLLNFLDVNSLKNSKNTIQINSSITEVFSEIKKNNEVHWLWKWFLALAIVSLCLEILILKFYKP